MKHIQLTNNEMESLKKALAIYQEEMEVKLDNQFVNARMLAIEEGDFDGAVDEITDIKMHLRDIERVISKLN